MPLLMIPEIGTPLKLTRDWTFPLHFESRNQSFGEAFKIVPPYNPVGKGHFNWCQPSLFETVTIPAGTVLKVCRIYIRSGKTDYNSLTFSLNGKELFGVKKIFRF